MRLLRFAPALLTRAKTAKARRLVTLLPFELWYSVPTKDTEAICCVANLTQFSGAPESEPTGG